MIRRFLLIVAIFSGIWSQSAAMTPEQMKPILEMTRDNWVSFRDYDGKQWIYFTHLEMYTCGIKEVRYSINSDLLDEVYTLQPCDPANPMSMTKADPYITMPPGTAESISVKLIYADGSESGIMTKKP